MGGIGLRHLGHGVWQREGCLTASRRGSGVSRQPQDLPRPGGCCLGPHTSRWEAIVLSQVSDSFMAKAVLGG